MIEAFQAVLGQYSADVEQVMQGARTTIIMMQIAGLAVAVLMVAATWKVFSKAGKPGWAAIIPIYNMIVLLQIVGKPAWWVLLMLIPVVNLIVCIIVYIELAKAFGQGAGFAIGLLLLGIVFFPVLGFGPAKYVGAPVKA
jgi:hypothetical protein